MNKSTEKIFQNVKYIVLKKYKFPHCQTYWLVQRRYEHNFSVVSEYSSIILPKRTKKEAELSMLKYILKEEKSSLDFIENENILTNEELIKHYEVEL